MTRPLRTALVWFHRDLRLTDHPALREAAERAETVVPVFVGRSDEADWSPGPAKQWWRARSLRRLRSDLRGEGLDLVVRRGPPPPTLRELADETGADALFFHETHVPVGLDAAVEETLTDSGVETHRSRSRLLHDPSEIRTTSGGPYHVFTPFWNKFRDVVEVGAPGDAPDLGPQLAPDGWPDSVELDRLGPDSGTFDPPLGDHWTPGESAAKRRLEAFAEDLVGDYEEARDRPDVDGSSRLSPRLHFGELSPRYVWDRIRRSGREGTESEQVEAYLREIAWREFSYHLMVHYPETVEEPLRDKYADFPWETNAASLERWKRGETGYPLVDAGMRQLRETGWMHNRVRMVVASFLTKDLLIPWQQGAEWFWERLVDADLPNNTMGWQWAAGCGADAQPFFRIFNPVSQSERHDPEGDYIRRWVPELADLPDDALHEPWESDPSTLREAGVDLGSTYPEPIVDHAEARERALAAWERVK